MMPSAPGHDRMSTTCEAADSVGEHLGKAAHAAESQSTTSSSQNSITSTNPGQIETPSSLHGDAIMQQADLKTHAAHSSQTAELGKVTMRKEGNMDVATIANEASSRKRTADGHVKSDSVPSEASRQADHSRGNSAASAASGRLYGIAELQATLKNRISLAKFKLDHGWQSRPFEEVEAMASQTTSPAMSSSTRFERAGSSASPTRPTSYERTAARHHTQHSPTKPTFGMLAPPLSIHPSRGLGNPRRNSTSRYTPAFLSRSQHTSPDLHVQAYSADTSPIKRHLHTPLADPMVFSPQQDAREKDAIESLLFMSSPNNSANLKHQFESSSQPLPARDGLLDSPRRTILPGSQPRRILPSGRQEDSPKRLSLSQGVAAMSAENRITGRAGGLPTAAPLRELASHQPRSVPRSSMPVVQLASPAAIERRQKPPPLTADQLDAMLERAADGMTSEESDDEEIIVPETMGRMEGLQV